MLRLMLIAVAALASSATLVDPPCYELQTLRAKPGQLDALHDVLRSGVLSKHGGECLAVLVPAGEKPDRRVVCVVRFPSLIESVEAGRAMKDDREWRPLDTARPGPELLVESVDVVGLSATDYSPEFSPKKASPPRVIELRTYTSPSPEKLALLHDRFRNHTVKLFEKHGMENLVYWKPRDIDGADRKLIYLLGHKSIDAAKQSFAAFRADPDWLAAKEASEKKAGGSLTEKDGGVLSAFFVGTDYSPLR